jgi:hypothetical protein
MVARVVTPSGKKASSGYTEKDRERAKGFEGCINMLTAMTVIVQVPDEKRSSQQREKALRFKEFGCTACHKLTPGKGRVLLQARHPQSEKPLPPTCYLLRGDSQIGRNVLILFSCRRLQDDAGTLDQTNG